MSLSWKTPDIPEREHGKPPSIWLSVVAFIVTLAAGIVLMVLTWEPGKSTISGPFFVQLLILLLIWGTACALIYVSYEIWIDEVDRWNYLCKLSRAHWRYWAQAHLSMVGSIALTPEAELAERLLGLEGSAPVNLGKALALPAAAAATEQSRIEFVLEQLMTPFAGYLSRFAGVHTFHIVLQSGSEQDESELRAVLQKLKLRNLDLVKVLRTEPETEQAMFEQWLSGKSMPDFCLLLGCQLHEEGKEPSWSEAAVGILFASAAMLTRYADKLKLQARLFRPISSASDSVNDSLNTLLAAVQTPTERIKHLWLSRLPRQAHHATLAALKDAGLELPAHDVDRAIGKPGPVNSLLLQALAAEMVQHGQGTQLVALPDSEGVMLNLVGVQAALIPKVEPAYFGRLSLSVSVGASCSFVALLFLLDAVGAGSGWFWCVLVGFVLLIPIQFGVSILKRRLVEDDFYQRLHAQTTQTST
ncbi:hypothetical protein [Caballeronia humi]|uniref:Uncharacterized protein n=1 Tax=Caballeronia humi TaxID=326474 RepID=A0A158IVM6_9BURK|nr:hypothetical protein [Caballeronia humi]SAL60732.1 hypothetical protein AWB65_05490 [Caballeronia humi]